MSLYTKPKSILDVPPPPHTRHLDLDPTFEPEKNTSEAALHRTLATAAEHHEKQFAATAIQSGVVVPEGEDDADFPRHVHSTQKHGHYILAKDEDHHTALLESGDWCDEPLEIVAKEE